MSSFGRFALPLQIALFLLLFFAVPFGSYRLPVMFGYILASAVIVYYVRRTHA